MTATSPATVSHSLKYSPRIKQAANKFIPLVKEAASDWMDDNAMRLAAALSLYTILSLAPLLVITVKVVGVFLQSHANDTIHNQLASLMGNQVATDLMQFLRPNAAHSGVIATIVSTAVLLFSATGVFTELQDSMNTIWGVKPKPRQGIMGFVRNRLLSVAMVFGVGFLLLVSLFISTMLSTMARTIAGDIGKFGIAIDIAVSLVAITVLFGAIYKFLPDVKLSWGNVAAGAMLTAALFTGGKYALALYFKLSPPNNAYGAAGAPVAVLVWVYYSSFILFFGAEFTKVWSLHHGHRIIPDTHAVQVTEEDRALRGIPSDRRMSKALSGQFGPVAGDGATPAPCPTTHRVYVSRPVNAFVAVASLVGGAVAARVAARLLGRAGSAADLRQHGLHDRMRDVEQRVQRINSTLNTVAEVDRAKGRKRA